MLEDFVCQNARTVGELTVYYPLSEYGVLKIKDCNLSNGTPGHPQRNYWERFSRTHEHINYFLLATTLTTPSPDHTIAFNSNAFLCLHRATGSWLLNCVYHHAKKAVHSFLYPLLLQLHLHLCFSPSICCHFTATRDLRGPWRQILLLIDQAVWLEQAVVSSGHRRVYWPQ